MKITIDQYDIGFVVTIEAGMKRVLNYSFTTWAEVLDQLNGLAVPSAAPVDSN
jgi:hypothetical protein